MEVLGLKNEILKRLKNEIEEISSEIKTDDTERKLSAEYEFIYQNGKCEIYAVIDGKLNFYIEEKEDEGDYWTPPEVWVEELDCDVDISNIKIWIDEDEDPIISDKIYSELNNEFNKTLKLI